MDEGKRGLLPGMITTGCAFAGGFIIMVLEIVGARYLVMDFGGSFYVWISQIGVIMIALSLGYYLGGALADRFQRAAFLTLLLIPTGIGTALIPKFSPGVVDWIIMRHPSDESIPLIWRKLDPALGSALIFLLPCLVLGMLSPYMVRLAATRLSHVGRVSGTIYAASTLGSVTGVFVSGYVLINLMRLSHIFYLSGGLICLLGLMCLFMDRWLDQGNTEWSNTLRIESLDEGKRGLLPGMITTGCAFAGGFIIMVLEIVGVRYLDKDFGGSFYVWISQIGVIMIALSLGYYLGGALADRFRKAAFLTLLLIPTGIGTALIPKFSGGIVNWIIMRHPADESIPLIWQKLDPAFGSALIFLTPCLFLGMLSPYMVRLAATRLSHVGRVSGTIYAASTLGSVTGVFVSGYVLINLMRLSHIFYLSGGLICLLGVMCLFMDRWLDQGNTE